VEMKKGFLEEWLLPEGGHVGEPRSRVSFRNFGARNFWFSHSSWGGFTEESSEPTSRRKFLKICKKSSRLIPGSSAAGGKAFPTKLQEPRLLWRKKQTERKLEVGDL